MSRPYENHRSPRGAKSPARRKCHRDGCPAGHVRNPHTNRCIHRNKRTYQRVCSPRGAKSPARRKCHRDGCPAWHVRNPNTNRCIHRNKGTYQRVCAISPKKPKPISPQKTKPISPQKTKPISPQKTKKVSSIVKLLDNVKDITSVNEVQRENGLPSTYLDGEWYSIPKVLRSGSRTFVPTKILGQGGSGIVFAYKEEGEEKEPDTPQNTIALKLVNGKSAKDSECQGTLDYFPTAKNVSQICKRVIYQRCISPKGFLEPPFRGGDISSDKLSFYIVMELMDGDFNQIQDRLTPAAKKKYVLNLKEALMCLLKHKRYYVDLKNDNVFFNYSKHYKGRGPINPKDIESIKLGDLGSICKKNETKSAYYVPPSHWEVFGGIGWRAPCTEDTMVWQLSALVWELYTDERIGGLQEDTRDVIQDRLTEIRKEITSKTFPKLPLSKFKEVFDLDLPKNFGDTTRTTSALIVLAVQKNKNRVRLKSLFS